jgi:hypothetical protein
MNPLSPPAPREGARPAAHGVTQGAPKPSPLSTERPVSLSTKATNAAATSESGAPVRATIG